jgi:hypothetical protein
MPKVCIRIVANPNPTDPSMDVLRTQLGDIVCIMEDSHVWSAAELNCGQYKFITVTGATTEELLNLVESVFAADESTMLKRRKWTLPENLLKGAWKNVTTVSKAQIDSFLELRT